MKGPGLIKLKIFKHGLNPVTSGVELLAFKLLAFRTWTLVLALKFINFALKSYVVN